MSTTVTLASDRAHLENLVPAWERLAASALEPNPFYEPWLLLPALRAFPDPRFRAACVWQGDKLVGFFPFRAITRYKGWPLAVFESWRHRHCLLCTPLVERESAAACVAALFDWLRRERLASILRFGYMPAGGPFHEALVDALNGRARGPVLLDCYTRGLLRREADAEAYIQSATSRQTRQKLCRYEKRLQEEGSLVHRVLGAGDEVGRWAREFLALEASGWKGREGSALACSEADKRFAEEVFAAAHARQRLVMVGLDLDGRPIARYAAFLGGEGGFAFKTAYDEAYRRFAPGLLAELDMIRALHATPGVAWLDSFTGRANSTIDRLWKHRRIVQQVAVGLTPWGELALLIHPLGRWAKRSASRFAQRVSAEIGRPKMRSPTEPAPQRPRAVLP